MGCSKVSAGCRGCYAEKMAKRLRAMALADIEAGRDPGRKRHYIDAVDERGHWTGKVIPVPEALSDPMRMQKGRMIFVNSMSDLFHPTVDFKYIAAVFGVMWASPQHIFQVLTKHPDQAASFFRRLRGASGTSYPSGERTTIETDALMGCQIQASRHVKLGAYTISGERGKPPVSERSLTWPLPNVWLGTSVENREVDHRIRELMACDAAVRWVSYEPALGPVDYTAVGTRRETPEILTPAEWSRFDALHGTTARQTHGGPWVSTGEAGPHLDWIVIGGESGCGARPFNVGWARDLLIAGKRAGVPVFVKQLGRKPYVTLDSEAAELWTGPGVARCDDVGAIFPKDAKGKNMAEWPEWLRVRDYPASAARLLEGA